MATYKNITIPKRGGGTRKQRVQVLASGKHKFVKNLSRSQKVTRKTKKKTKRRRVRRSAKKKTRRNRKFTLPIAVIGGVAGGFGPPLAVAMERISSMDYKGAMEHLSGAFTGIGMGGEFHPEVLAKTYGPIIIGALVHKFVGGTLGVNRMLAAANVPIIRI